MAFDFESALKSGKSEQAIKSYLSSKGRVSEYDAWSSARKSGTTTEPIKPLASTNTITPTTTKSSVAPVPLTMKPQSTGVQSMLAPQPEEKGFVGRLLEGYGSDVEKFKQRAQRGGELIQEGKGIAGVGTTALGAASAGASAVFRPVTQAVGDFAEGVAEGISDSPALQKFATEGFGSKILGAVDTIKTKYGELAKTNPDIMNFLGDATEVAMTLAGEKLVPTRTVGELYQSGKGAVADTLGTVKSRVGQVLDEARVARETKDLAAQQAKSAAQEAEMLARHGKVDSIIDEGVTKGIKPSVGGKTTIADQARFKENARNAVKDTVLNKDKFVYTDEFGTPTTNKLPTSVTEQRQAVQQGKKEAFDLMRRFKEASGESMPSIEVSPIVKMLEETASNKVIKTQHPETASYAKELADRYKDTGSLTFDEAESLMASINNKTGGLKDYNSIDRANIDLAVNSVVRKQLDDSITNLTGEGYQEARNLYGAYRSIEDDVIRRELIEARKNGIGLIDAGANILSGGQLVSAIVNANPTSLASAAVQKGIAEYTKWKNSPNTAIKKMYEAVDKDWIRPGAKQTPEQMAQFTRSQKMLPEGSKEGPQASVNVPIPLRGQVLDEGAAAKVNRSSSELAPTSKSWIEGLKKQSSLYSNEVPETALKKSWGNFFEGKNTDWPTAGIVDEDAFAQQVAKWGFDNGYNYKQIEEATKTITPVLNDMILSNPGNSFSAGKAFRDTIVEMLGMHERNVIKGSK